MEQTVKNQFQKEVGFVTANKQYLLSIEGLPSARVHDIIMDEEGRRALVTGLVGNSVEAMTLDSIDARPGQRFELLSAGAQHLYVGDRLLGRVINALGDPVDGLGGFPPKNSPFLLDVEAPGLAERQKITRQLVTGFSMIDSVLPIGKGQRQLLMGPVRSGIETFCSAVIRNQAKQDMVCIYALVGKPASYAQYMVESLLTEETAKYTIVISSSADEVTPVITITPAVALLIAEYFCATGKDVLLVLDDLYTHAKYIREIALLEGRLPGRESYPGDIFYQQAHLIERGGSFKGKGSITLLPTLQTDIESYTDLITTNIMGTTDGHLSFLSALSAQGIFPAVLEEASVTRVGKNTQTMVQKQLSTAIVALLADVRAQQRLTQFSSQLSETVQEVVRMGEIIQDMLNQVESENISIEAQVLLLSLCFTTFSSKRDVAFFRENKGKLVAGAQNLATLEPLRKAVHESPSFNDFLRLVEKQMAVFEQLCHK